MRIQVIDQLDELTRDVWDFYVLSSMGYDSPLPLTLHGHYVERRKTPRARKWEAVSGWRHDAERWGPLERKGSPEVPQAILDRAVAQLVERIVFRFERDTSIVAVPDGAA